LLEHCKREGGAQHQDDDDDGSQQRQRDVPEPLQGTGSVDVGGLVELPIDTLQRRVHQQDGEGQRAPNIRYREGQQCGRWITGPVDRLVNEAEREQDAVEEAEVEIEHERPDEAVGDRWHRIGDEDQELRDPRGPHLTLIDQQRDRNRQYDLGRDRHGREDQGVLERQDEQRITQDTPIVVKPDEGEDTPPQLGKRNLVERQIRRIEDRIGKYQGERQKRRNVHHNAKPVGRWLAPKKRARAARGREAFTTSLRRGPVRTC